MAQSLGRPTHRGVLSVKANGIYTRSNSDIKEQEHRRSKWCSFFISYKHPEADNIYSYIALVFSSFMGFSARPQSPPKLPTNPATIVRNRSRLVIPFLKCLSLCFASILLLVTVLGSGGRHRVYNSYRRLQEGALQVITYEPVFNTDNPSLKNAKACSEGMEDHVPCYSVRNPDRACDHIQKQCIIRPPKGYRLPQKWPSCANNVWSSNVKIVREQPRRIMMEENVITFPLEESVMENYVLGLQEMLSKDDNKSMNEIGVRVMLDIGGGLASFAAHLLSKNVLTMSISAYEEHGAAVQIAQERGLPALIGSFSSKQLPFPFSAYDAIHCSRCDVQWHQKDGLFLFEANRLLRPGGYFIWTLSSLNQTESDNALKKTMGKLTSSMCWSQIAHNGQTIIWQKTTKQHCYSSRRSRLCQEEDSNTDTPWNKSLKPCVTEAPKGRWRTVQQQHQWPNRLMLTARRLARYGMPTTEFNEDVQSWLAKVINYWSLLTPVIFSDHPKRPGADDPSAPQNVVRNVMDMNAQYGGFNAALLTSGKPVWVMNVVPTTAPNNTLSAVFDRGLLGVHHDWCEAFPAYPRSYDLLYGTSLLSQELTSSRPCGLSRLVLEMDRLLRPEGWLLLQDETQAIETTRSLLVQIRWEARIIQIPGQNDQRLLIGQKNWRK